MGLARLALGTGARIFVGASYRVGEGTYKAEVVEVPRSGRTGRKKQDIVRWAQDSLLMLETFIGQRPEEWLMPLSVWAG